MSKKLMKYFKFNSFTRKIFKYNFHTEFKFPNNKKCFLTYVEVESVVFSYIRIVNYSLMFMSEIYFKCLTLYTVQIKENQLKILKIETPFLGSFRMYLKPMAFIYFRYIFGKTLHIRSKISTISIYFIQVIYLKIQSFSIK